MACHASKEILMTPAYIFIFGRRPLRRGHYTVLTHSMEATTLPPHCTLRPRNDHLVVDYSLIIVMGLGTLQNIAFQCLMSFLKNAQTIYCYWGRVGRCQGC